MIDNVATPQVNRFTLEHNNSSKIARLKLTRLIETSTQLRGEGVIIYRVPHIELQSPKTIVNII